jgi:gas vesicle protein
MEQWNNTKNSELSVLLTDVSNKFKELVKIYTEEEQKKLEKLVELQKAIIDNVPK